MTGTHRSAGRARYGPPEPAPGHAGHAGHQQTGRRHAPSDETVRRFVGLSAALTGYDAAELWGTGMVHAHLDATWRAVGSRVLGDLLSAWANAAELSTQDGQPPLDALVREMVLAPASIGPVACNVVILWYLGEWDQLPADWRDAHGADAADTSGIASPEAYAQGLVWDAIGTHPQGAKMPGYGSWALPPEQRRGREGDA
jgi:hypothetical protein